MKLVRDKIPLIIEEKGETPLIHIADQEEYQRELKRKLQEEVDEYFQSEEKEELADILEVLYALAREQNISPQELEHIRENKAQQKGMFEEKIILEKIKE